MPTFEVLARFLPEYDKLTRSQQEAFRRVCQVFVEDLRVERARLPGGKPASARERPASAHRGQAVSRSRRP